VVSAPARPRRSRLRSVVKWSAVLVGVVVAVSILRLGWLAWDAYAYPRHGQDLAARPAEPNAVRIVVFSGSEGVAVGALRPEDGFAGRISAHVTQRLGRPVHLTNLSVSGATVGDALRDQLPKADLVHADLVIVALGSNDIGGTPLPRFRRDVAVLMARLPADRTVVSDTPLQPGREPYQQILAEAADAQHIRRADFAKVFRGEGHRLDIFAGDFQHLNSRGYYYWFVAFRPPVDEIIDRMR
jgi:hypothetical protein